MSPYDSQSLLQVLQQRLELAQQHNQSTRAYSSQGSLIKVPGLGKAISSAYEQLRNAAEYTEEHLLLQRAIRRYYYRTLPFLTKRPLHTNVGEELIVELTQAGYLQNNSYGQHIAHQLQQLVEAHVHTYWQLREQRVGREKAIEWTLDELSVSSEELLNPHYQMNAIAYVAYSHFLQALPKAAYLTQPKDDAEYEICLYIATLQALLKADTAAVRHDLIQMYNQGQAPIDQYAQFNKQIDKLYTATLTQSLRRAVSRYGAPMRILKSLADTHPTLHETLGDREAFLHVYKLQTSKEYKGLGKRLNKGIIKSIIFIFITKVIIGIGVEIPYDLLFLGSIALVPLLINLLVPPIYMASLRLGLRAPSAANAAALTDYIDRMLYSTDLPHQHLAPTNRGASAAKKLLYTILFFIPFAVLVYGLYLLDFTVVQGVIFFIFLSTASFLGFRLATMIRELELLAKQRSILSSLRDFFYLPFILVGQWLSRNYARVNAVGFFLDMVIELPLKTVMRLTRQWRQFLNEKHDELYE